METGPIADCLADKGIVSKNVQILIKANMEFEV
jgi:hypothetical protein